MVARYRRAARTGAELELGTLAPLDQTIPELAAPAPSQRPDEWAFGFEAPLIDKAKIQAIVDQAFQAAGWGTTTASIEQGGQQPGQLEESEESPADDSVAEPTEIIAVAPAGLEPARSCEQRILRGAKALKRSRIRRKRILNRTRSHRLTIRLGNQWAMRRVRTLLKLLLPMR